MREYQLEIDPRILELLGPNLYTNIYYVLAELIANAYDADAKNVYILSRDNDIIVEDDGHGMSYSDGDIDKFLSVARVSRNDSKDSYTQSGARRKMGRKGVGKLAALSVSENVDVMTIKNGEKSGFILTRKPESDSKLKEISEEDILFCHVKNHGTSIVMRKAQYTLHKTLSAIKRNLLKIFPLVNKDFRIHIIIGNKHEIIDEFDKHIMKELSALITLGNEYKYLCDFVDDSFPEQRSKLVENTSPIKLEVNVIDNSGMCKNYELKIEGWIGTYRTTRGRKAENTDFPDNFISLYANKKMGEFNILPIVGQNRLIEVFVVGQLHVDLFELSELPDMALSNRQGYKSDDPRYEAVIEYVRRNLLPEILSKRKIYADFKSAQKKLDRQDKQKKEEDFLKELVFNFKEKSSFNAAEDIINAGYEIPKDDLKEIIYQVINNNMPDLGIKSSIDSKKKKILISQTYPDKSLADIIYRFLVFNNVPEEDILYTNCDDEVCRIPEGTSVYGYLRDFFVESYSDQKIFVIFVTSENTKTSWGALTEVGASWITQVDHKVFNIPPFRPEHPLDDDSQWHTTIRDVNTDTLHMSSLSCDIFCQKIEDICDRLGYQKRTRDVNKNHLQTLIQIR